MSDKGELCTVDGKGVVDDAWLHAEILGEPDLADLALEKSFNPDQPRDDRGRFSSGGSSPRNVDIPPREDQDTAATGLKSFADMVAKIQPRGTDGIISASGKPYHFDDKSFAGSHKTMGMCYQEAGHAALGDHRLTYVEGYVSVHGVPIHHAWTVDEEGRVHDPTLKDGAGVKGYFGVPFKTGYLRETILRTKVWGLF